METKSCNVITLENGIEYTEIMAIENEDNKYVFLSNLNNPDDFCIRKLIIENNEELLIGLNSEEEFDKALALFANKIK